MAVTPDLTHATFRAGVANGGLVGLFRVPLDASTAPIRLNEPFPGN